MPKRKNNEYIVSICDETIYKYLVKATSEAAAELKAEQMHDMGEAVFDQECYDIRVIECEKQ